jgi:hypothetical protein
MNIEHLTTKLTKNVFLVMPAGAYLVSNLMVNRYQSVFGEVVAGSPPDRSEQWKRILEVGADQRLCRVFGTEDEFTAWLADITGPK